MATRRNGGLGRGLDALINVDTQFDMDDTSVIQKIDIDHLHPNVDQPRKQFDQKLLEELATSIKESGVIIPIIVTKINQDDYKIVAGERRWRASKLAGLKKMPCIVRELSDVQILQQALIENLQRQDLNPLEESYALKKLIDEHGMKHEELSLMIGKSRPTITNMLRLLNLSDGVKLLLSQGQLTVGHARALLSIESEDDQFAMANKLIEMQLSVRDTEKLVKSYFNPATNRRTSSSRLDQAYELCIKQMQERFIKALGAKVVLKDRKNKGTITIKYASADDLERILNIVEHKHEHLN